MEISHWECKLAKSIFLFLSGQFSLLIVTGIVHFMAFLEE